MDLPDNQLDYIIGYSLDTESIVTTNQKQAAWAALQAKAANQVIMAPYAESPRPRIAQQPAIPPLERFGAWVLAVLTDESRYERAATLHRNMYSSSLGVYLVGVSHMARFSP